VSFIAKDDPEAALLAQLKVFFQEFKKKRRKTTNIRLERKGQQPQTPRRLLHTYHHKPLQTFL